jgi:hypothetical protein
MERYSSSRAMTDLLFDEGHDFGPQSLQRVRGGVQSGDFLG